MEIYKSINTRKMCSVVEIKNQDEYYIHYHSPESLESQQTEEPASLCVVEELFKRDTNVHQDEEEDELLKRDTNGHEDSLNSSVRDSSLESELKIEDTPPQNICEESTNVTEEKDKDFSVVNVEVSSATTEKPVFGALVKEADVSRDEIIGRQIFDGILQHRLGHGAVELSNKDWQMSVEKGKVLEELETEVEEIKRIFKESNGGSFVLLMTSKNLNLLFHTHGDHILPFFAKFIHWWFETA